MIHFKENSFIIEVNTVDSPVKAWQALHNELIDLLMSIDPDRVIGNNHQYVFELLQEMMPSDKVANRMQKNGLP